MSETTAKYLATRLESRAWEHRQHRQLRDLAAKYILRQSSRIADLERQLAEARAENDELVASVDRFIKAVSSGPRIDAPDAEWKAHADEKNGAFDALAAIRAMKQEDRT